MAKKNFYAVKKGLTPGIYKTWEEAKVQIDGFPKAEYKGFVTLPEAEEYIYGAKQQEFEIPSLAGLEAYVDGSYNSETGKYSFGAVILYNGEVKERLNGVGENEDAAKMRNVAGELKGAMTAMKYAVDNGYETLTIYHDYEGIGKWAQDEWKANLTSTKQYKEYYKKIKTKLKVSFVKVAAHTGVAYNEEADKLAKDALGINAK